MTGNEPVPIRIERATLRQVPAMAQLHSQLFETPWSQSSMRQIMDDRGTVAFVAASETRDELAAFLIGRVAADEAELLTIAVARAWQRRGIARQLMDALCKAARQGGARRLYLEVAERNNAARALYNQFGAQELGRRISYYAEAAGGSDDAINLAINL